LLDDGNGRLGKRVLAMSSAPVDAPNPPHPEDAEFEEMPRVVITRQRALIFGVFVLSAIAFLYFVLPQISGGTSESIHNLGDGKPGWLVLGFVFEGLSFAGYVILFRTVFVRGKTRIGWRASYEITMAGVAATRLFAAAGAGGVALTAWALRRSGMERRVVACRMVAFLALLYVVYMGAIVVFGLGLYLGLFPGPAPFAITVVPAIFALAIIAVFLAMTLLPGDAERRIAQWAAGSGRGARIMTKVVTIPASAAAGVRTAIELVRDREWGVLGAIAWWAFDISTLWACFHAYGPDPPPFAVIVLAYFVGMLGNALPLPGGIGGVDGGMIGAFAALGVASDYAISAVLTYRAFAFWLPTLPGAIAYFQLRRRVAGWREEHRAARAAVAQA
jgi:putative heme transporter